MTIPQATALEEKPIATLLKELADSLNEASGGAEQLIIHLDNPDFIVMENMMALLKEKIMSMATFQATKVRRV